MKSSTIRCNDVRYRQGFIELIPNVHAGHVNIEVWNIHPDLDITGLLPGSTLIPDGKIIGNTEIELSIDEAEELVAHLQLAIHQIKNDGGGVSHLGQSD